MADDGPCKDSIKSPIELTITAVYVHFVDENAASTLMVMPKSKLGQLSPLKLMLSVHWTSGSVGVSDRAHPLGIVKSALRNHSLK